MMSDEMPSNIKTLLMCEHIKPVRDRKTFFRFYREGSTAPIDCFPALYFAFSYFHFCHFRLLWTPQVAELIEENSFSELVERFCFHGMSSLSFGLAAVRTRVTNSALFFLLFLLY